eukprot:SAG31_NODE_14_length_37953_cov_109.719660_15_plen_158_part_00
MYQSPMEACSPVDTEDLDRPLELDEPRWLKLLGGGKWELYPNRTNRQLEKKHRVYAQHQRAILERRSKDFYNSRRASDKALGEAANSTLVDETEYLTDADHIQLNVGVSVDFVKMTEVRRPKSLHLVGKCGVLQLRFCSKVWSFYRPPGLTTVQSGI